MAITYTPKFALPQWGDITDPTGRTYFNTAFTNLESAAKDLQGLFSARPAFGKAGTYYYATDKKTLYRDTGTAWEQVGGTIEDLTVKSAVANTPGLVVQGAASQTGDVMQVKNSAGTVQSSLDNVGSLKAGGTFIQGGGIGSAVRRDSAALSVTGLAVASPTVVVRGIAAQTAQLARFQNSSGTNVAMIDINGNIIANNINSGTTTERNALANKVDPTLFFDKTTGTLWVWNGATWIQSAGRSFYVSTTDPGAVPNGDVWFQPVS